MRYRVTPRNKGEVTYIPTTGDLAHAGAMAYLAVLAYPLRREWKKRDKFIEHMKGGLVKRYWGPPGSLKRTERRKVLRPKYTGMRRRNIDQVLGRAFDRIQKRLWAGQLAFMLFSHGLPVGLIRLQFKIKSDEYWAPRSVAALHQFFEQSRRIDSATFRHRIWASALPVLHLAMVYPKNTEGPLSYEDPLELINHPEWLEGALATAEAFRVFIGQCIPSFNPQTAVRLLHRSN